MTTTSSSNNIVSEFDTVIHLIGEQLTPVLIATRCLPAKRHIFVASMQTKHLAVRLSRLIADALVLTIDNPFSFPAMATSLRTMLAEFEGTALAFDLTGGTKPMFAAGINIANAFEARIFYVDTANRVLRWLDGKSADMPLRSEICSVEDFITLAGHHVRHSGDWHSNPLREHRREITLLLWQHRREHKVLQRKLSRCGLNNSSFSVSTRQLSARFTTDRCCAELTIGNVRFDTSDWPDFRAYLLGHWLEEYCYLRLEELLHSGSIFDLRIGLVPSWDASLQSPVSQELDITFTDGLRLFVLECKSSKVTQPDIQKLENITQRFGGFKAVGIIVAPHLFHGLKQRVHGSRIAAVTNDAIADLPTLVLNIRPGQVHNT